MTRSRSSWTSRKRGAISGLIHFAPRRSGQLVERPGERSDADQEVEHFADQEVDAARGLEARAAEDVALDLAHVLDQLLDDELVVVDDLLADGVEDRARAEPGQIGIVVDLGAGPIERGGGAVADRQHVPRPDEHAELAAVDLVGGGQVPAPYAARGTACRRRTRASAARAHRGRPRPSRRATRTGAAALSISTELGMRMPSHTNASGGNPSVLTSSAPDGPGCRLPSTYKASSMITATDRTVAFPPFSSWSASVQLPLAARHRRGAGAGERMSRHPP